MPSAPDARRRQLILATLCLALFMSMLDNVVVSNALPSISTDLHARDDTGLQWVMEGYSLVYASLLLLGVLSATASDAAHWPSSGSLPSRPARW